MGDVDSSVTYSVKELLARQDGKLDAILVAVQHKVDRREFEALQDKVGKNEARLIKLEDVGLEAQGGARARKALFATAVAALSSGWWLPDLIHKLSSH